MIKNITLVYRTFLLHAKLYWLKEVTNLLWYYALNSFAGNINGINMDCDGATPMEKFDGTITEITLK